MARARQSGLAADAPDLLVLAGPPAKTGTADISAVAASLPAAVTSRYAIVVVDLRGTGGSSPLGCLRSGVAAALLDLPDARTDAADIEAIGKTVTLTCSDEADTDLTRYNLTAAADDLDSVRAALGASTINLLGTGFGATLGVIYADRYPGRVGRLVADAPTDPLLTATSVATNNAVAAETTLKSFLAACPAFNGGCPLGSDPGTALNTLIASRYRANAHTIGAQSFGGGTVLLLLLLALSQQKSWRKLASALAGLRDGQPEAAGALLATFLTDDPTALVTASLLYGCNDYDQRLTAATLTQAATAAAQKAPVFGAFEVGLLGLCGTWPTPESPLGGVKALGAPPVVVIGAVNDPLSSYPAVQSVSGQLSSAVLLSWQSSDHVAYPASACITKAVNAYLLNGTPPAVGTLCPP